MTPEMFEELINQREGETLEFKQEMPSSSDLAKLITALYNTRGGMIVFGVENDTRRLAGIPNPQGVETGIVNIIQDRCSLDVMPCIEFVSYQHMEFVVVTCPQGARKPYLVSRETRPYIRVGSSNREAQDEEIRRMYIEGSEGGFEGLPSLGATLADLSEALIAAYIRRREEMSGQPLDLSWEEALRNLGCVVEQGEIWVPTNAGVMLFAEAPQRFIGQAEVTCVRFKGTDVVSYIDRRDLRGPLYQLVDDAEQFIYRHMKVGRRIEGFVGVEYREYPGEAVREAIVNAVVHRDYSRQGQRIRVFMFDDRIEVYSPGTLPPGVSLEKMRRLEPQSVLRNPVIVGVFRDLGSRYIERLGTGIRRMALTMEGHGLSRPRFEEVGSEFRVTLMGPGERFMAETAKFPAWTKGLNERQVEAVLYVGEHRWISRREYAELLVVSSRTAARDLSDLVERGILVLRGAGRGAHYVLGPRSV
ncbi:MAG: putative DNA binding domain-containing protein [Desulfobacterales bacterium]|nr:putative DNA binding domain-containing protein [Desulfobacterales bacterium]